MIEQKMDIYYHYLAFQFTFEYIFHKINIDKMNMNAASIKDIDKQNKNLKKRAKTLEISAVFEC